MMGTSHHKEFFFNFERLLVYAWNVYIFIATLSSPLRIGYSEGISFVTLSRSVITSLLPKTRDHNRSQNYSLWLIRQVIPQNQITLNYPNVISGDSLYLAINAVKCSLKAMKILRLTSNGEATVSRVASSRHLGRAGDINTRGFCAFSFPN